LQNYHQNLFQLSSQQAGQLVQIAQNCVQQVQGVDAQAAAIIQAARSKYAKSAVPPPPAQLAQLQAQRSAIVLAAVNSVAAMLGPAQFTTFNGQVQSHIGSGLQGSAPPQQ
jgi:hypothetical protein